VGNQRQSLLTKGHETADDEKSGGVRISAFKSFTQNRQSKPYFFILTLVENSGTPGIFISQQTTQTQIWQR